MVPLSGQNSKVEGHVGGVRCKTVGFYNFGMPAPSNCLGWRAEGTATNYNIGPISQRPWEK